MKPTAQLAHRMMIESVDRRSQAVALRREGKTYERIGRLMGISKQAAWSLVTDALKERRQTMAEDVDSLKILELDRLDRIMVRLLKRLDDPKNASPEQTATVLIRVSERRARLVGMDAPVRLDLPPGAVPTGSGGDPELARLSVQELLILDAVIAKARGEPALLPENEVFPPPPDVVVVPCGTSAPEVAGDVPNS